MQNIKIEEIARELGMNSKDLIQRVQLLYEEIKSAKSEVSVEIAQEIFEIILFGEKEQIFNYSAICQSDNIDFYFSSQKIDVAIIERIASIYKVPIQKEYMIRSFNYSELSIVKILTAGLIDLDIKKYASLQSTNKELSILLDNINKIFDDVNFEDIDTKSPLDQLEKYINDYQPEIVYIEGIEYSTFIKYKKVFELIKTLAEHGIQFVLGFSNMDSVLQVKEIQKFLCIGN